MAICARVITDPAVVSVYLCVCFDMDRILIEYERNNSTRYDGREYFESISKIPLRNASSGNL